MINRILIALTFAGLTVASSYADYNFDIDEQVRPKRKQCGITGTLRQRIDNCAKETPSKKGSFVLVTRTHGNKEIYLDVKTNLMWGDQIYSDWEIYTVPQHSPNYMSQKNASEACKMPLDETGNMTKLSWRLPKISEWQEANGNGIRNALPDMNNIYWSLTTEYQGNSSLAFDGNSGEVKRIYSGTLLSVRCVAQLSAK